MYIFKKFQKCTKNASKIIIKAIQTKSQIIIDTSSNELKFGMTYASKSSKKQSDFDQIQKKNK